MSASTDQGFDRATFGAPDFDDDAATLVTDRLTLFHDAAPPALPFALKRRTVDEDAWLASLPDAARTVLLRAREPMADWPRVGRPRGAIALPLHKIPSLHRARSDAR